MLGLSLIYNHTLLIMLNLFIYYSDGMFKVRSTPSKLENSFWN